MLKHRVFLYFARRLKRAWELSIFCVKLLVCTNSCFYVNLIFYLLKYAIQYMRVYLFLKNNLMFGYLSSGKLLKVELYKATAVIENVNISVETDKH